MGSEWVTMWLGIGESAEVKRTREAAEATLRQHQSAYGRYFHVYTEAQEKPYKDQLAVVQGLLKQKKYAEAAPALAELGRLAAGLRSQAEAEIAKTNKRIRALRERCRSLPGGRRTRPGLRPTWSRPSGSCRATTSRRPTRSWTTWRT